MKKILKMAMAAILFAGLLIAGCIDSDKDDPKVKEPQIQLLILQAYGNAGDGSPEGVSHSFVELYNISDEAINLEGIYLYYADGKRDNGVTADEPWKSISLTGTIPAKGSFLILGAKHNDLSGTRYKINDGYGDINDNNLSLNRRGFKVALIKGSTPTVQNPFNSGNGRPVSGYIDMVGALNNPDATPPDHIFGYETAPARCSASEAVRRRDLIDTDDNSTNFIAARYASTTSSSSNAVPFTKEMLEVRKPRNSSAGSWNPFAEPAAPVPSANTLLIFQVYGAGPTANDGSVSHTFVELYNNSDAPINLSTFSLQYADGISSSNSTVADWTVINLNGTIPAHGSFLIRGKKMHDQSGSTGRLQLNASDQDVTDFNLSNRSYKVVLMSNQTKLTVANPFNTDGNDTKVSGYIDMVGVLNAAPDAIDGYETSSANIISKQKAARRKSLVETDDNSADFTAIDYRLPNNGINETDLAKFQPRTAADGTWTPQF